MSRLKEAVEKGLVAGVRSRDAIIQFLSPRQPWPTTTFNLDGREHLKWVNVAGPDISAYGSLFSDDDGL